MMKAAKRDDTAGIFVFENLPGWVKVMPGEIRYAATGDGTPESDFLS
jgi:hypothetical protein